MQSAEDWAAKNTPCGKQPAFAEATAIAGMLYLPRLFVYHCEAEAGSKQSETFKVMERRLPGNLRCFLMV
jgi:uncharacterized membrane protein